MMRVGRISSSAAVSIDDKNFISFYDPTSGRQSAVDLPAAVAGQVDDSKQSRHPKPNSDRLTD